jgi:hypothetical protein
MAAGVDGLKISLESKRRSGVYYGALALRVALYYPASVERRRKSL